MFGVTRMEPILKEMLFIAYALRLVPEGYLSSLLRLQEWLRLSRTKTEGNNRANIKFKNTYSLWVDDCRNYGSHYAVVHLSDKNTHFL
jgi:hypothetical protein